ncbi:MAG: sigma-54-dependent Fis family transcriptional regulator [Acidobacteriota bacterium]|nr:sigma-54-dependent Fis family transcriptional regulator [Blastocatellia bacterium]MDW8240269.1 sigma-54-dependent Fis family transcriptional regulator [Acidobacteriota bacterium]
MRRSDSRSNRVGEREVRSATLPTNFLYHLLTLASRPATNLDRLVCHLLERALALTRSDVGGGLFVFELFAQEPKLVASALRGALADTPADLVKKWKQNPRSAIELVIQSGRWYSSDDHRHDPTHFPLLAGSRSSLWVPLLDGAQVMGILYVESSRPRYYREAHRCQLETLAADAVLAIRRLLFREEMRRSELQVDMIGASSAFLELERQIRLIASTNAPVLITGARGSGKEVAARAIHFWSDRRDKPFVPVLVSALPKSMVADELFGHERHAFTGAASKRAGKFQAAEGGTLFLDEIADTPRTVQAALLRVIEYGEVQRIGRDVPLRVDVRLIAATNQDLSVLLARRRFREDLYDRLSVFALRVPPLRERREDIPLLAGYFLQKHCQQMRRDLLGEGVCGVCHQVETVGCATTAFYEALQAYDWPGNVRELEHLIQRLVATVPGEILDVKHLPEPIRTSPVKAAEPDVKDLSLEAAIRDRIELALQMTNYNQSQAARMLKIPLSTLHSKMKKLGIEIRKK